jgi:hypothetical protein
MRKLFAVLLLLSLAAVPAAYAAGAGPALGDPAEAEGGHDSLTAHFSLKKVARPSIERAKRRARARRKARAAAAPAVPPQLQAIASCESGGNPRAVSSTGMYRGKYQFSRETWAGVGGSGDPAAASEAEQDRRAAMLYARSGAGQWPVCGS